MLTVIDALMLLTLLPCLGELFFCRQRGRLSVLRNIDWSDHIGVGCGPYLCPTCGQQYRSWMETGLLQVAQDLGAGLAFKDACGLAV